MKLKPVSVWTWAIEDVTNGGWCLCYFTARTRFQLMMGEKPSPEARPVRVLMRPYPKRRKREPER